MKLNLKNQSSGSEKIAKYMFCKKWRESRYLFFLLFPVFKESTSVLNFVLFGTIKLKYLLRANSNLQNVYIKFRSKLKKDSTKTDFYLK